ncbi:methylenetetrahydrofolate reductase [candidate division WOR-3 bacterium]|nr:methylenetetrahydrofolate reductase [candidate division WOR-3 bacterium]
MKITEIIQKREKTLLSFEVIPPERGASPESIFKTIDRIICHGPKFISVTNKCCSIDYTVKEGKVYAICNNKKPGTIGLSAAIRKEFGVETVPHIICAGMDRFKTENLLIDLHFLGFENLFAVRGDPMDLRAGFKPEKEGHMFASELISQITGLNHGKYTEKTFSGRTEATNFCVGAAVYPERHNESLNDEEDMKNFSRKFESGASFAITQAFYGFNMFRKFIEKVRKSGISIPVIPGLKPILEAGRLGAVPRIFSATVPPELVKNLTEAKTPEKEKEAGIKYMSRLLEKLLDFDVPCVHLFTMGNAKSVNCILENFRGCFT